MSLVALGLLVVAVAVSVASAEQDPLIVVFYEDDCLNCENMRQLLEGLVVDDYDTLTDWHDYEDPQSGELLSELCRVYDIDIPETTPIVFVNDQVLVGTLNFAQERLLTDTVSDCLRTPCESPIARLPQVQLQRDLPRLALLLAAFLALAWLQMH